MEVRNQKNEFTNELNRRIAILTTPDHEALVKPLGRIDYALIGVAIVFSIIIFIWGWY